MNDEVVVGKHQLPLPMARHIIEVYTSPRTTHPKRRDFFSWPYYDHMATESGPNRLGDGDLLAPVLLNVNPRIHGFAELQRIRARLEVALGDLPTDVGLEDARATSEMIDQVASLFAALDDDRVLGVEGTTLSKVLHRKRPRLIPLHDRYVRDAYQPSRVSAVADRSWVDYMRLLITEMQHDLRSNAEAWTTLTKIPIEGGLTPLRALDMIAWWEGKQAR